LVALLGANGAGKSTLLKILATLVQPTGGSLAIFGQSLQRDGAAGLRARLGLIGHGAMVYRDLTAMENLLFFGRMYGVADTRRRALELLDWIGLTSRQADPVKTFSRGMMQRVSIARVLMHDPELLLADEPFAGLDAPSTCMVESMLTRLHEQGKTIILATHDIRQSLALAKRVLVLRRGSLVIDEATDDVDSRSILAEVSRT
jgi:heme exporter protein A